eukprot:TRINITY_DN2832_c0_g2_i3.p2 TRINITY_DN2832_c0_g2~~TRINITY_DN2832_c0_g2_i3.p2  ORF type:complete len:106 (+),score=2.73 TRINITY_DN2832_c0_g2_i3:467-784(+)
MLILIFFCEFFFLLVVRERKVNCKFLKKRKETKPDAKNFLFHPGPKKKQLAIVPSHGRFKCHDRSTKDKQKKKKKKKKKKTTLLNNDEEEGKKRPLRCNAQCVCV